MKNIAITIEKKTMVATWQKNWKYWFLLFELNVRKFDVFYNIFK